MSVEMVIFGVPEFDGYATFSRMFSNEAEALESLQEYPDANWLLTREDGTEIGHIYKPT